MAAKLAQGLDRWTFTLSTSRARLDFFRSCCEIIALPFRDEGALRYMPPAAERQGTR